ncbi:MAG: trypsin-like peptidase domain-containing protein [bacterium]
MPKLKKIFNTLLLIILITVIGGAEIFFFYSQQKNINNLNAEMQGVNEMMQKISDRAAETENNLKAANKSLAENISELQKKVGIIENKEPVALGESHDEILTAAVAKIAPAVVSIVITKDVPKLEIVYENPFGDDPFFQDFGIRVPRYRQKGTESQKVGAGTGFLIAKNGYIITNRHVVEDDAASYTALLSDGKQLQGKVIYKDKNIDAAIIKVEGDNFPFVALGDSASLKLGQSVFAVGNALGEYNNSVSTGIISGLNRDITASGGSGSETLTGVIQTDAAINPGNSGGPLVTIEGHVIGVNVATVQGSNNISFSVPINMVKEIIEKTVK